MFNYLLFCIGELLALRVPLRIGYMLAVALSDIRYLFAGEDRYSVFNNLKVIFPDKTDAEIKKISRGMFRNFAKYLVDFFRFAKINKAYIRKNVSVEHIDNFDAALAHKKGIVCLTAHIGNWELGGAVIGMLGYPFWVVALPHKYKKLDEFFNNQRGQKGVQVIALGRQTGRECLRVFRKNAILALLGDRDFTEEGVTVDFFGKPTMIPEGPAVLSLKSGAPIIPGFMVRNTDDSFTLRFEEPIFPDCGKEELMRRYLAVIESYIRRYPDQWFMFRKFWRDERK